MLADFVLDVCKTMEIYQVYIGDVGGYTVCYVKCQGIAVLVLATDIGNFSDVDGRYQKVFSI